MTCELATALAESAIVVSASGDGELRSAIVGGFGVAVGALVGGLTSGFFLLRAQNVQREVAESSHHRRTQREIEAEEAVAKGSARTLQIQLWDASATIRACARNRVWWPEGDPIVAELPLADKQLLARHLDATEWGAVALAEFRVKNLAAHRLLDVAPDSRDHVTPFKDEETVRTFNDVRASVDAGIRALEPLTGFVPAAL